MIPSNRGSARGRRDAFPPEPDALVANLSSGIYPELLGNIIPSNSGTVPMTAGRFPV